MLGSQPEQPVLVLWSVSRMGRTAGPTNGIIRGARAVLGSQLFLYTLAAGARPFNLIHGWKVSN